MDINKPLTEREKRMYMVQADRSRLENIINCQIRAQAMYFSHGIMSHKLNETDIKSRHEAWEFPLLLSKTMKPKERLRAAEFDFKTSLEYARTARVLMGIHE